jgi:predicted LPLAT superfamily acyltransferase
MSMSFTPKTEEQLAWDLVKAAVRSQVNLEVANYRNRRINEILAELWPAFEAALMGETILELDPQYETWVSNALEAGVETGRV